MRLSIGELATAVDGSVEGDSAVWIEGATQDSREVRAGQLFVPLVAERDGHDFIPQALAAGAAGYFTSQARVGANAIVVDDTMLALSEAGRFARSRIDGPVIGITGSVGKTSAKDLLAGALSAAMPTHASTKSFNNEIGVPLTLLNAPDDAHAVVLEMGARGIGHIATLCDVASPRVGIVTTVAGAHLGEFGSIENIAIGKGELVEALPADGLAVLNDDNSYVLSMRDRTSASVLTFGARGDADIRIADVTVDDELRPTVTLETDWGRVVSSPPTRGAHMAPNVAAAVAAALWLGVSIADVEAGIASSPVSPWRMEVFRSVGGATIINDTYNANPTSMRGALDSLRRLPQVRKIAVVGYMAELGEGEGEAHLGIARDIRDAGIELVAVGTDLYGVEPVETPLDVLANAASDTAVLIKASRSAGLEQLADALR